MRSQSPNNSGLFPPEVEAALAAGAKSQSPNNSGLFPRMTKPEKKRMAEASQSPNNSGLFPPRDSLSRGRVSDSLNPLITRGYFH